MIIFANSTETKFFATENHLKNLKPINVNSVADILDKNICGIEALFDIKNLIIGEYDQIVMIDVFDSEQTSFSFTFLKAMTYIQIATQIIDWYDNKPCDDLNLLIDAMQNCMNCKKGMLEQDYQNFEFTNKTIGGVSDALEVIVDWQEEVIMKRDHVMRVFTNKESNKFFANDNDLKSIEPCYLYNISALLNHKLCSIKALLGLTHIVVGEYGQIIEVSDYELRPEMQSVKVPFLSKMSYKAIAIEIIKRYQNSNDIELDINELIELMTDCMTLTAMMSVSIPDDNQFNQQTFLFKDDSKNNDDYLCVTVDWTQKSIFILDHKNAIPNITQIKAINCHA